MANSTTKSTSRRDERKDKLRAEILEAANTLFAEHGYENVTLRAIAERIGYSHATIYQHFPDKSHILSEICQQTFTLLIAHFDSIAQRPIEPEQRLFETSRGLVRFCLDHPQHVRVVFFGPENRNGIRAGEYINQIGSPLFDRFVAVFRDCMRKGDRPVANVTLAAHTWWCSIFGLAMVLIIQGELPGFSDQTKVVELAMATMWAGLGAKPQRIKRMMTTK